VNAIEVGSTASEPVSEFRVGATAAQSCQSSDADELYTGHYDLLICFSGWDERAISILDAKTISASLAVLVTFEEKDETGYRDKHDAALEAFLPSVAPRVARLIPSVARVEDVWEELRDVVAREYLTQNRSLKIAIDSSVCPRYITLALLAFGLNGAVAEQVDVFYAEGLYPEKPALAEVAFTVGLWRTIPIPGLEGRFHPSSTRYYLISVGFEGHKTLRVVNTADPDRISILLPDPGTHPDYVDRTLADNVDLLTTYRVPATQMIHSAAGDAIGAWKALAEADLERFDSENVHYLCSGTKAHSVALALRALTRRGGAVLYNVPERYSPIVVKPSGKYWKYTIQNLSAPTSLRESIRPSDAAGSVLTRDDG
jgi:hypothetical protein